MPAPFNIGRPTWEPAPGFDIRRHILRMTVPKPVSEQRLMELAAELYSGRLDRSKPLWEMHLVEVEGGRSAVVTKIHHCLVDGVGGVELAMVMLDVSPDPPPTPPPPLMPDAGSIPGGASLFFDGLFDGMREAVDRWEGMQRAAVGAVMRGDLSLLRAIVRALAVAIRYFAIPVRRAGFNHPLSPARRLAGTAFPFEEFRQIRKSCGGGTVNDVALAVLGGALGPYQKEHGEPVDGREMRVLTPVNVRRENDHGKLGNRMSMLLVEVPLGVRDPVERLAIIRKRTEKLKRDRVADGIDAVGDAVLRMPAPLIAAVAALGPPPNTLANLVFSNVPGPMIPLYTVGHRMLAHYVLAPLTWGMGLGCVVISYDKSLFFTLQSDPEAAPDLDRLRELLEQSYFELKAAAAERVALPSTAAGVPAPERRTAAEERGAVA
ncbi:MAG: wax ester/triacylglycerol synthase family O-acyltransferase [Dehalococcoidia bacterium]|nr:wax ester/triacylglycerol synthase family O-acyltransferase [Dehalococcoidia bacterium]